MSLQVAFPSLTAVAVVLQMVNLAMENRDSIDKPSTINTKQWIFYQHIYGIGSFIDKGDPGKSVIGICTIFKNQWVINSPV